MFAVEVALRFQEANRAQELMTQLANSAVRNLVAAQMRPPSLNRQWPTAALQKDHKIEFKGGIKRATVNLPQCVYCGHKFEWHGLRMHIERMNCLKLRWVRCKQIS